jgi:hypothetical protein
MLASTAHVATDRPTLYLKRLCEHFADPTRRHSPQGFEVTFDDHEGLIDFAPVISGTCRLDARREGLLVVEAAGIDQSAPARTADRHQALAAPRRRRRAARRVESRLRSTVTWR